MGIETAAGSNWEAVLSALCSGPEFPKTLHPIPQRPLPPLPSEFPFERGNLARLRLKGRVRRKVTEMSSEAIAMNTLSECHWALGGVNTRHVSPLCLRRFSVNSDLLECTASEIASCWHVQPTCMPRENASLSRSHGSADTCLHLGHCLLQGHLELNVRSA